MNLSQARDLIDRLEAAFDRRLPSDTRQIYEDRLTTLPFSVGTKRVEKAINSCKFMPKIAELLHADEERQNVPVENKWLSSPDSYYAVYRADALVRMTEEDYQNYLIYPDFRAETENQWRQEWTRSQVEALE